MTPKQKPKTEPENNGVVPELQNFTLELTAPEVNLIHLLLTNVPLQSAEHKWAGATLQQKIEQLAQGDPE